MTTAAIPRPRVRTKRPKPPSRPTQRMLAMAACLAMAFGDAPFAMHDPVYALLALLWVGQFCSHYSIYRAEKRTSLVSAPLYHTWLCMFAFSACSQAVLWLALL